VKIGKQGRKRIVVDEEDRRAADIAAVRHPQIEVIAKRCIVDDDEDRADAAEMRSKCVEMLDLVRAEDGPPRPVFSEELQQLMSMGFPEARSAAMLLKCHNRVDVAATHLMDATEPVGVDDEPEGSLEVDTPELEPEPAEPEPEPAGGEGNGSEAPKSKKALKRARAKARAKAEAEAEAEAEPEPELEPELEPEPGPEPPSEETKEQLSHNQMLHGPVGPELLERIDALYAELKLQAVCDVLDESLATEKDIAALVQLRQFRASVLFGMGDGATSAQLLRGRAGVDNRVRRRALARAALPGKLGLADRKAEAEASGGEGASSCGGAVRRGRATQTIVG
jgi:hypothetical protein